MGANVLSHTVCVMIRAQRVATDEGKKGSESLESDNDHDNTSSGSSEELEDHQQRDYNSDEEKGDVFEQNKHIDDIENKERPIRTNNNEWKANRKFHREVSKTVKEM